jgi:hypothetical protein
MDDVEGAPIRNKRSAAIRIAAATGLALSFCLAIYLLLEALQPGSGLVGFTFLLILPAIVSAFVAYAADPWRERPLKTYLLIPLWILIAVIPISIIALREGVICVLILSPLWLGSGMVGTAATYALRQRIRSTRNYCAALFVIPLVAMQIEPLIPLPEAHFTVTREVVVDATPEKIWPLLEGINNVQPGEGAWTFSHNIVGLPRPVGAHLVGKDIGADRLARWAYGINFRERITEWELNRKIGWDFVFDNIDGWEFTDRHLMPNSPYYHITKGGYSMTPLANGQTEVKLHTSYWIQTPVNAYSQLWGEVFIGDMETNLLTLVKNRAEGTEG